MRISIYHRAVTAVFLIGIGTLLLMNNLQLLPFAMPAYVFTWQMLLMVLGVYFIFRLKAIAGIILLSIGGYFIAPQLFDMPEGRILAFWPILLIFAGILFLFRSTCKAKRSNKHKHWGRFMENEVSNEFNNVVIFGGESKKVNSFDFKGGKLVAVFGGLEVDLTNCTLNQEHNVVEVVAVFGGIELIVPHEWNVKTDVVQIMGGVEDSTGSAYIDPAAVLHLKGVTVFGGVEIKRV